MRTFRNPGICALTAAVMAVFSNPASANQPAQGKSAAEILSLCQSCHSGAQPAGGLDLTSRDVALKAGAIDAGKPLESKALSQVEAGKMPPGGALTTEEKRTFRAWIASGSAWPSKSKPAISTNRADKNWWSLKRPVQPPIPVAAAPMERWVKSPIDAFLAVTLASKGLTPSRPASRPVLIRRATFDLTGLPPTPAEVAAFCADKRPDAYEHLVDRLLASPHYGERWARHWLDVARFGESMGYEYDHLRENAWHYRDWVIQALNADMPFTEFIKEQIAGDVMPGATPGSIAATGFLVGGPMDEAGKASAGILVRQRAREEEMEDIVGLVGQTCLGLTVNCARCHDHKFDPIAQKDYYRLKAALIGVNPGDRPLITADMRERAVQNRKVLTTEVSKLEARLTGLRADILNSLQVGKNQKPVPPTPMPALSWQFTQGLTDTIHAVSGSLTGAATQGPLGLKLSGGGSVFRSDPLPLDLDAKTLEAWVYLDTLDQHGGSILTIEADNGTTFDAIVFGERQHAKWISGSNNFQRTKDLSAAEESQPTGMPVHMAIVYSSNGTITLYRNGRQYADGYAPSSAPAHFPGARSHIIIGQRHTGSADFLQGTVLKASVYDRALTAAEIATLFEASPLAVSLASIRAAATPAQRDEMRGLEKQISALNDRLKAASEDEKTYGVVSGAPEPTFVLARGDLANKREHVTPGGIEAVCVGKSDFGLTDSASDAERRLRLADWIVAPENPLTARVMVNRVWQYHFGTGIVGTPNDFGYNGERPSNPKLLDWLACRFVAASGPYACNGSLKKLHRLILLSSAYTQSSEPNAAAIKVDADDRFLWRFPPRRLEAEEVRDAMLAVSGEINWAAGGPSFRPFTVSTYGSNFYAQFDSDRPEFNRRSIYRMSVQSSRNALLEALDCPDPSTKTPRRTSTTTPIQALEMMNEPFVLRQAERMAAHVKQTAGGAAAQCTAAFQRIYSRNPTQIELAECSKYLQSHSLSSFCWALLNSSEFVTIQ
jgi:Protein of unknown function (DUF1553)/Protein of unknown function (DUF1549)/Concanavalin A-like lectin/glucanases superfamily/Planctomycete cytochrome C